MTSLSDAENQEVFRRVESVIEAYDLYLDESASADRSREMLPPRTDLPLSLSLVDD